MLLRLKLSIRSNLTDCSMRALNEECVLTVKATMLQLLSDINAFTGPVKMSWNVEYSHLKPASFVRHGRFPGTGTLKAVLSIFGYGDVTQNADGALNEGRERKLTGEPTLHPIQI